MSFGTPYRTVIGPTFASPAFRAAAHRQSRAVATSRFARRDQAFIKAITLPLADEEG